MKDCDLVDAVEDAGLGELTSEAPISEVLERAGVTALREGCSPDQYMPALRSLGQMSAGTDKLRIVSIRTEAIRHLEKVKLPSAAKLADAVLAPLLKSASANADAQGQGTVVLFEEIEPWPETVDAGVLLDEIAATYMRFLILPDHAETLLALFVLHTWAFDAADTSPIIAVTSPEMRCGKTLLLEVSLTMVRRPLPGSNVTAPAMFRAIEQFLPTFVVDEADSFFAGKDDLRGIINSGHRRSLGCVVRTVGDDFHTGIFRTFCPKMIALIGHLPATVEDRSIPVRMRRKTVAEKVERLRFHSLRTEKASFRRKAARWATDNLPILKSADPEVPPELGDRAADCWRPLLTIAEAAGKPWLDRAQTAAKALSGPGTHDEERSHCTQLLADIKTVFGERNSDSITSDDLCKTLATMEDRPWPEIADGKGITPKRLAGMLKEFDIRPRQIWDGKKERGYRREWFVDAWSRYLSSGTLNPVGAVGLNRINSLIAVSDPVGNHIPTTSDSFVSPWKQMILPGLPDQDRQDESPGRTGGPDTMSTVRSNFQRIAAGNAEARALAEAYRAIPADKLPKGSFTLRPGTRVADPDRFFSILNGDVARGNHALRARIGDLKDLIQLLGYGP